uniref:Uncharacterized protein n=1 Tax=Panagrolaimus superbus TaxID=310955 RepID=A0A914YXR0_9BILA
MVEYIGKECRKAETTAENLLHAPMACSLIQTLAILAKCTKDVSLISDDSKERFDYLKRPNSFRASLYEVINAMCKAFRTANNAMDKIHLSLESMPDLMNDCLEALYRPNDPDSQNIIDYALSFITDTADKCVKYAQEADKDCQFALSIIEELSVSAAATQGLKERRTETNQIEYDDQLRQQKQTEEAIKEYKNLIKEQKQVIEDAREDYKIRMAQSTDFTGVFGAMFVDNFEKIVSSAGNMVSLLGGPSGAIIKAAPGVVGAIAGLLKDYTDSKKESLLDKVMDGTVFDLITKIINESYEDVTAHIEIHLSTFKGIKMYESKSNIGKMLQNAAENIRQSLKSIQKKEPKCKEEFEVAKGAAIIHLRNYETMMNFLKSEEETFQQMSSEERETVMKIRLDNLKVSRETLAAEREYQEKLRKEKAEAIEKYSKIITNLALLKIEEIDLKEVLIYLQQGVKQLTKVQVAWGRIVDFFSSIKNMVDGPLVTHIKGMSTNVKMITDKEDKSVSVFQRKLLLREIMKACAVSYVLMESAEIYKTISQNYITPVIDGSILNIALTKDEAKEKLHMVSSDFDALKAAVQDTLNKHTEKLSATVYAKMEGLHNNYAIEDKKE